MYNAPPGSANDYVMKEIGGYTIFIIFPQYWTKYRVSRSHDYTQTLLSMISKQEVCTEHAQYTKLLHFLSIPYESPTQGASFHRVTWLATANIQLYVANNSQVDRTPFIFFTIFIIKLLFVTQISIKHLVRHSFAIAGLFRDIYR